MINKIKTKLKSLPHKPGIYEMLDSKGSTIYIGKAINLHKRISSYFNNTKKNLKTNVMVNKIKDFSFIITKNEVEALILESNIIKNKKPKYNIVLKDDKNYPYIKIMPNKVFPFLEVVRKRKKENALYFGPYISSAKLKEVTNIIESIFMLRTCSDKEIRTKKSPCLNYHIKRCLAPCVDYISKIEYKKIIDNVILFLSGKNNILIKKIKENMQEASMKLNFEMAIKFRNQIKSIKKILEKQQVENKDLKNKDIIGFYFDKKISNVFIFFSRNGKIIGKENFILNFQEGIKKSKIINAFLEQYYSKYYIPKEIIILSKYFLINNLDSLLSKKSGRKVIITIPKKGKKRKLAELANKNSKENYYQQIKIKTESPLKEIKKYLNLKKIPKIIEGYDVSHIQGINKVSSVVVFKDGLPFFSFYKRFNIKTVIGINDFKSIEETIKRRFENYFLKINKFNYLPDLIIIDGGKGQLSSAKKILNELKLNYISIFALAKKEELLFGENNNNPIKFPKNSKGFYLIQRVRDEAHRFAISFHKQKRNSEMTKSILDTIKGIGIKRKKILLKHFGSFENIKKASLLEIKKVLSNLEIAKRIKKVINNE